VTWWSHSIKGLHRNDFIMAARTDKWPRPPRAQVMHFAPSAGSRRPDPRPDGGLRAGPQPAKFDLGVGVYKDAQGLTPIPGGEARRAAPGRQPATKTYIGGHGDAFGR
jgi:hypothetical protein